MILLFSIDVPSGWDVNDDGTTTTNLTTTTTTTTTTPLFLQPNILISLTVPKLCAKRT
jgi:NAD(P)H-hydrate repair Nnr-like enzyme with NAD(P)H-hydrate epimerase domain